MMKYLQMIKANLTESAVEDEKVYVWGRVIWELSAVSL